MNVDVLSQNPIGFLEQDENFGSDVMEQKEKLGIKPAFARSYATNEVSINVFTLQPIGPVENDAEEHHLVSDYGKPSIDSSSKEGLPQMD